MSCDGGEPQADLPELGVGRQVAVIPDLRIPQVFETRFDLVVVVVSSSCVLAYKPRYRDPGPHVPLELERTYEETCQGLRIP